MISKELFDAIRTDFVESQEFIELVEFYRPGMELVCHHNSYLVAGFLERRGNGNMHWVTGYYQCHDPEKRIHHSWIKLVQDGKTAAIFEFDPRQLHEAGGYDDDPMPSGQIPELSTSFPGTASIVDPKLVKLSEEAKDSPWVVSSREVISRYVEFDQVMPEIDFADLDELGREVGEEFEAFAEFRAEDASE
jgi:hypothetical protein